LESERFSDKLLNAFDVRSENLRQSPCFLHLSEKVCGPDCFLAFPHGDEIVTIDAKSIPLGDAPSGEPSVQFVQIIEQISLVERRVFHTKLKAHRRRYRVACLLLTDLEELTCAGR
jgi:hypothetical protein